MANTENTKNENCFFVKNIPLLLYYFFIFTKRSKSLTAYL